MKKIKEQTHNLFALSRNKRQVYLRLGKFDIQISLQKRLETHPCHDDQGSSGGNSKLNTEGIVRWYNSLACRQQCRH